MSELGSVLSKTSLGVISSMRRKMDAPSAPRFAVANMKVLRMWVRKRGQLTLASPMLYQCACQMEVHRVKAEINIVKKLSSG